MPTLPTNMTCVRFEQFLQAIKRMAAARQIEVQSLQLPLEETQKVQFKIEASAQLKAIIEENDKFIQDAVDQSLEAARPILEKAWGNYARLYSAMRQMVPGEKSFDIPADIADSSVRNAGNIGNILSVLATRLYEPQTYLIVFAALLVDLVLIGVLRRLLESGLPKEARNPFDSDTDWPENPLARR